MRIIQLMMAAALWAAASAFAQTDAGMITQLNGEASITGGGANSSSQPVVPFLKIAAGDKINLTNGAQMKIVYFGNGRQETWKGGGQIEALCYQRRQQPPDQLRRQRREGTPGTVSRAISRKVVVAE